MSSYVELILESLQYDFILKGLLAGLMIGLSSAFLGVFLVLKRYAMIGDGLAHVSFATVAVALLLNKSPILISIPLVVLASIVILKLTESDHIDGDGAIGIISAFSIALGVIISSVSSGFSVDLFSYLFGSILIISNTDLFFSLVLTIFVLGAVIINYNSLFAITYDEKYSKAMGLNVKGMNYLIIVLTSITIVLGIRVLGTMLISSMVIFPTITALQVSKGFKNTICLATIISLLSVVVGIFTSYIFDIPTGATIVMINTFLFVVGLGIKKITR